MLQVAPPVLVLVGRPNVGKSTLFNRLTGSRDALVADFPGLTRDRQYGRGRFERRSFIVVDTGGLMPDEADPLALLAEEQAGIALAEADRILFLVDARAGMLPTDRAIAERLRGLGRPVTVVANKAEGLPRAELAEFHALGFGEPISLSAERGDGVAPLLRELFADLPETEDALSGDRVRVAVIGRPNAGKSTLANRLLGENRLLTADLPGTTRDAVHVQFEYHGRTFELIDTAGIRRRGKVDEMLEKLSIVKALQAIEQSQVVIALIDARGEIAAQDARLLGLAARYGRAMVLAINKWDGLDPDDRNRVRQEVDYRMPFLDFVPVHYVSALHGSGLSGLMRDVLRAHASNTAELPTPKLTRVLEQAVERHQPPAVLGRRIRLRYAHQGGHNPPLVIVHGNQTERLPDSYRRYLANTFRDAFNLCGVPLKLEFKTGENPFKGRRNELTERQRLKRRRMMAHVKR
jgi:ribosome-associated GTPase EngA